MSKHYDDTWSGLPRCSPSAGGPSQSVGQVSQTPGVAVCAGLTLSAWLLSLITLALYDVSTDSPSCPPPSTPSGVYTE